MSPCRLDQLRHLRAAEPTHHPPPCVRRGELLRLVVGEVVFAPQLCRFLRNLPQGLRCSGLTTQYGVVCRVIGLLHRRIIP